MSKGVSPDGAGLPMNGAAKASPPSVGIPDVEQFYIIDLRSEWRHKPYITVWRPDDAGYAYPLIWAGRYSKHRINQQANYYYKRRYGTKRTLDRFPVPCDVVDALAVPPRPREIDGDAGPVLPNDGRTRQALRKARYIPAPPAIAIDAPEGGETHSGSTEGESAGRETASPASSSIRSAMEGE